uniref:ATP-dependent helicase n=1 Tax=Clostridium acetobutylicum TaxID=1488 RepID=UPI000B5B1C7E|nr:ATP-dependent helicase [Clostridium acetobutylicum]
MEINKQQKEVINLNEGIYCVSAGAGSGKTFSLVQHIIHLVNDLNIPQSDILLISFTRAAVNNLKKKLEENFIYDVSVHTFHSLSAKILSEYGLNVSKTLPVWKIQKEFEKINSNVETEKILSWIGFQKNHGKTPKDKFYPIETDYTETELRAMFKLYENLKEKENCYDFEDWIILALEKLKKHPRKWKYVMAGEVQDSNDLNIEMIKLISKNLICVGDVRQAIYSFRGSSPQFFLNFDKEFNGAKILHLDINYRSKKNIVDKSNKFIKPYFKDYKYYSDSIANFKDNGEIKYFSFVNKLEESEKISNLIKEKITKGEDPNNIAVLYRLNDDSSYLECVLRRDKIPYYIENDSSFFKRKEIAGIMGYLRLIQNSKDDGAFLDVWNLRNIPLKYMSGTILSDIRKQSVKENKSYFEIFKKMDFNKMFQIRSRNDFIKSIEKLKHKNKVSIKQLIDDIVKEFNLYQWIKEKYPNKDEQEERKGSIDVLKSFIVNDDLQFFIDFVQTSNMNIKKKDKDGVKLMSIHRSKGLEWKSVFVIGIQDTRFPNARNGLNEEARLFYVATTRAIENLYLSEIGRNNSFICQYRDGVGLQSRAVDKKQFKKELSSTTYGN